MRPASFQDQDHKERFEAAAASFRWGPGCIAPRCGARTRTGAACALPPMAEGRRCLRHAGPHAARAHHETLERRLERGTVSPAQFARSQDRRARNALRARWERDPSLPGSTIELGAHEEAFREALAAGGMTPDALLPAVADWLRWRFRRACVDRSDEAAWRRALRVELPARQRNAAEAMAWVRLGGLDRRTRAARAIMAALRRGGMATAELEAERQRAAAEQAALSGEALVPRRGRRLGPGSPPAPVRPWRESKKAGGSKRSLPDQPRRKAPAGRPRQGMGGRAPTDPAEVARLLRLTHLLPATLRRRWAALADDEDRLRALANLSAVLAPCATVRDQLRWVLTVAFLRGG